MTTTTISRLLLDHPDLGTTGGAALHAAITALYTKIGDNMDTRYLPALALATGASVDLVHNFKTPLADLRYDVYTLNTGTGALARVTATSTPNKSQFTLVAKTGAATTTVTLTNNSGATYDLVVLMNEDPIELDELTDVDTTTTPPDDGQALVWNATSSTWVPGASGDSSFKLQTLAANVLTIKKGFVKDSLGRIIGVESDLVANLKTATNTAGVTAPAASSTYWLYADLAALATSPTAATTSGYASLQYYPLTSGTTGALTVLATSPENTDLTRYYALGVLKTDGSSNYSEKQDVPSKVFVTDLDKTLRKIVSQATHGFVTADVGSPLYLNTSGVYVKAKGDSVTTAEVAGLLYSVLDANRFLLATIGEVSINTAVSGGALVIGSNYFLSAATAGALTATEPSVAGQISKPVGIAKTASVLEFQPARGAVVGAANFRTVLSLANNATTTIQSGAAYQAGEIAGWIDLQATTPLKFYVQAQFAKNGAGTNYNIAYQTTGDTPPTGFVVAITAAGLIQITLPSITGFTSCTINFALNAPAVGATFPLTISGKLLSEAKNVTVYTVTSTVPLDTTTVAVGNSASAVTFNLPTAVGIDGSVLRFKNIGTGVLTLDANASETIDGALTVALYQNDSVSLLAYNGNWLYVAKSTNVGSYLQTYQTAASVTRNTWVNMTTLSLPPGDWDVSGIVMCFLGAGTGFTDFSAALSLFSGATTTDHLPGDNEVRQIGATASYNSSVAIPSWRVNVTTTTNVYIKVQANTSSGNPTAAARISARSFK